MKKLTKKWIRLHFLQKFQLTASRRSWLQGKWSHIGDCYFNSQPHEEADQRGVWRAASGRIFQLTASRRGWLLARLFPVLQIWYFNSQPHEEADNLTEFWGKYPRHFNSQPHEEADSRNGKRIRIKVISTHSLTKRLTDTGSHNTSIRIYFNSQPHEEADFPALPCFCFAMVFQLTASRRGWRFAVWQGWKKWDISTHSLTKRLTRFNHL